MRSGRLSKLGPPGRAVSTIAALATSMIVILVVFAMPSRAQEQQVSFSSKDLAGANLTNPTSLQFGPDGRLYVSEKLGTIKAFTVERTGAGSYSVTDTETINAIKSIPNHNDNGALNGNVNNRQITGILVTGTASNPVIYVTSSDSRIGGGTAGTQTNLDTNSGVISRLTKTSSGWQKLDLVRGLPRSEENHSQNGLQLDEATNTLYVASGGNANMGAPSNNFNLLPEYALSAAILSVDLGKIGNSTYDIPTLKNTAEPFGGQDGENQAKVVSSGPVQVYSPGYRNPYDVVLAQSGKMYVFDHGPNSGWGGPPVGEGPGSNCTNAQNEEGDDKSYPDTLHYVTKGYYAGHANPTRGNPAGSGFAGAVPSANAVECDYRIPNQENGALASSTPTGGMTEYAASNFGGSMKGDLLLATLNGTVQRMQLNSAGDDVTSKQALFEGFGSFTLDVTAQSDDDPFPGTIWAANFGSGTVTAFEPGDFGGGGTPPCDTSSPGADADADGYTNADEQSNGTDPCSAASKPNDFDNDGTSNKNDPDDDNDSISDISDKFAVDPDNGKTTSLPVELPFSPGSYPETIVDLGFTGLMTNGKADYQSLYDENNMTAGGAAQVLTVDEVPNGDATSATNPQKYGFQLGFAPEGKPFTAHTRIKSPFPEGITPQNHQSVGFFLGTGDQANYVKLVVSAKGGSGGIQFAREVGNTFTNVKHPTVTNVKGNKEVDLFLKGDPATNTVEASYSINGGQKVVMGVTDVPASWMNGPDATAAGLISTSFGTSQTFPASWDFLDVKSEGTTEPPASKAKAKVTMTPGGNNINASTYNAGSFKITNQSATEKLDSVTLDLGTAVLPDMIFDPEGKAGDKVAKQFTVDSAGGTGQTGHTLLKPHNGQDGADGYDALKIDFNDFGPGETFSFSIDVDPNSIKGTPQPGPNEAGSVSGLELSGSTITALFNDGTTAKSQTFSDGSKSGSAGVAKSASAAAPKLEVAGVSSAKAKVADADQTVKVTGPPGAKVQLLRLEAGLFVAQGGYNVEPFDANSAVALNKAPATIGSGGVVDIPVTLTRQASPEAGLNHLVAVVEDAGGEAGLTSNVVVLDYDPDSQSGNQPPSVEPIADQQGTEGEQFALQVNATDPDEDALSYEAAGLPAGLAINESTGRISGTIAAGASANSPHSSRVTVSDGADESAESFQMSVSEAPSEPSRLEARPADRLGFGKVEVGSDRTRLVELTNTGGENSEAIEVAGIKLTGDPAYSVRRAGRVTIDPGESHILRVTLAPDRTGSERGSLTINHDGENSAPELKLVGRATPSPSGCTIMGTGGDDTIRGTSGPDVICSLRGDDKIYGLGGEDILKGGPGVGRLYGGAGDDRLVGAAGNDNIRGGGGNDTIFGGPGRDRVFGEGGRDRLNIRDKVRGNDYANGGPGRDRCIADPRDRSVNCP